MRFFKYLIFIIPLYFLFSQTIFAAWYGCKGSNCTLSNYKYYQPGPSDLANALSLCQQINPLSKSFVGNMCMNQAQNTVYGYLFSGPNKVEECWHPDYKIVSQNVNNKQIKSSICVSNNGAMCKYVGSVKNVTAINGYISTVFNSVSKTPDPNCKEDLVNPPCDPKDPYGGCYTPPNQECTRQFDGSIVCPEEKEPPIEQGCNGADFCNRPPQGCGEGYVSGTYNGERICIKSKPSSGTGSGDGSGTGSSDGSGTGSGDGSGTG
jgi:uncharacterized membrane protein YgcG